MKRLVVVIGTVVAWLTWWPSPCVGEEGQREEAIGKCREAVARNPRNVKAWYSLGVLLESREELEAATRAYERGARLKDGGESACRGAALAEERGEARRAETLWRLGLRDAATRPRAWRRLVELLLRRGRFWKARWELALALIGTRASGDDVLELAAAERRASGALRQALQLHRRATAVARRSGNASRLARNLRSEASARSACARAADRSTTSPRFERTKYYETARACLAEAVELAPDDAETWTMLATCLMDEAKDTATGRETTRAVALETRAAAALRKAVALRPDDGHARALLASVDASYVSTEAFDSEYVRGLFERYAPTFDASLVSDLRYVGHDAVVSALASPQHMLPASPTVLDLGAGTGLAGPGLRHTLGPDATLVAVDLSPGMLERARDRRVYDALHVADVLDFLATLAPNSVDAAVAADVLIYLGDLRPLFAALVAALRPGGLFAATLERPVAEGRPSFYLASSGRFVHSVDYVRDAARAEGLLLQAVTGLPQLRLQNGRPVPGDLVLLARPSTSSSQPSE